MTTTLRPTVSLLHACPKNRGSILTVLQSHLSTNISYESKSLLDDEPPPPLVRLNGARLGYPSSRTLTKPFDLTVCHPSYGGHVLLGRNGVGKTLVSNALVSHGHSDYLLDGSFVTENEKLPFTTTSHVSFESHEALLNENCTTYRAIASSGNLNKAAQFLIVRFGLYPLLHREVTTLSTGEIRKVLLVRALSQRPRLLLLDNAFDGLDVASRENLKALVSKTLQGFRPDILVQGVNANATAHTQVLMITHRSEEIVDEIEALSYLDEEGNLVSEPRDGRSGMELLSLALKDDHDSASLPPTVDSVASWWNQDSRSPTMKHPLVQTHNLFIQRGDATLVHDLSWTVREGERWLVAGANGSGKSTLSRLVAKYKTESVKKEQIRGNLMVSSEGGVGWVSTELHMAMAQSSKTTRQVLLSNDTAPPDVAVQVARWLQLDDESLLSRPFAELSQGQQKLVLVAAALASRPRLLVLDEPCQGLDWIARRKLLALVERVCQATDMSLVYITHHLEETLPSIGHVLHLHEGKPVFHGRRQDYDPDNIVSHK